MGTTLYGFDSNNKAMRSQTDVIKNWFLTHRGQKISHTECERIFGFTRLGARVHTLRHKYGLPIHSEKREVENRYGGKSRPAFYWLDSDYKAVV